MIWTGWLPTLRLRVGLFFLLFLLPSVLGTGASAKQAGDEPAVDVAAPTEERLGPADRVGDWDVWRDPAGQSVRRIAPRDTAGSPPAKGAEPVGQALLFLDRHADLLGVEKIRPELEIDRVHRGLATVHVVLRRVVGGVPVEPGRVAFHMMKNGELLYADVTLDGRIPASTKMSASVVDENEAIRIATSGDQGAVRGAAERVYREEGGVLRLTWRVRYTGGEDHGSWEVWIDGATGREISRRDRAMYVNGKGKVWSPNPVNVLEDLTLQDLGDSDQQVFDPAYQTVTLYDLADPETPGEYALSGPYVRIIDYTVAGTRGPPHIAPPVRSDPDSFQTTRENDDFEAVMSYYHIDKVQRYIRSLGYDGVTADEVAGFVVKVDAHALSGADNSMYDPADSTLFFGDGCVDDAEDADVIVHEYGHTVEYSQVPDWGYPGGWMGAMAEGFSDYWAESHAARTGITFDLGQIFDWDRGPVDNCWPGRRIDNDNKIPDDLLSLTGSNIYTNSLIWSGALWDVHALLGGMVSDKVILESHLFYNGVAPNVSFEDGAYAILQADQALNGGANELGLFTIFWNRGILSGDIEEPVLVSAAHPESLFLTEVLRCTLVVEGEIPLKSTEVIFGEAFAGEDTAALIREGEEYVGWVEVPEMAESLFYAYRVVDALDRVLYLPEGGPEEAYLTYVVLDDEPPEITYASPPDVYDSQIPVKIGVKVTDNFAVDPDSVWVDYVFFGEGGEQDTGSLFLEQEGDVSFRGTWPVLSSRFGQFRYSITAVDLSAFRNRTVKPEAGYFSFFIVEDLVVPQITHTPLADRIEGSGRPSVWAMITDNGALDPDSLFLEYDFQGARKAEGGTVLLELDVGDTYRAEFPTFPESVGTVTYRIVAVDAALASNRVTSPSQGTHSFTVYPSSVRLQFAGPNPFPDRAEFVLFLDGEAPVRFEIYDVAGRLVRRVMDEPSLGQGSHLIVWDGENDEGRRVAQGIYVYRLEASGYERKGRIVHIR